jgi:lysophospholipid acyltransferase (LPLAT)-like uncharacterized protein
VASEYKLSQRLMLAVVPRVAAGVIRALTATLRFEDILEPGAQTAFDHPRPILFVFWHRALLVCAGRFRKQGIAILISQSFDGELIARTIARLGFVAARGSSTRGGVAGLMAMQQAFAEGRLVGIPADGPLGPKYVAKPGAVQLAQLTGSAVCALHVLPQRAWTLRSWDGFLIPKLFSRVVVTYPAPVAFHKDAEAMQAGVQAALDRAVEMAEQHWSARP